MAGTPGKDAKNPVAERFRDDALSQIGVALHYFRWERQMSAAANISHLPGVSLVDGSKDIDLMPQQQPAVRPFATTRDMAKANVAATNEFAPAEMRSAEMQDMQSAGASDQPVFELIS